MGWLSQVVNVHNLCRVSKTKYLAVSLVTDNPEQLNKDVNGGSHHSNFSNKIWRVNKCRRLFWMCSEGLMTRRKKFYKLGKIGFMQNSLQTPQAKYAYRLLEFSTMSLQSVTCQIHSYGSDQSFGWNAFTVAGCSDEEWGIAKGFESSTNMFACGCMKMMEAHWRINICFPLLYFST